jgi:integrase
MNLKYFIIKGKSKNSSIYLRFWDSKRFDQKAKTGISVLPEDWSDKKQRLKLKTITTQKDFLNNELNRLEQFITDQYNLDFNNREYISSHWLKEKINAYFGRVTTDENYKIYFIEWVDKFIDSAPARLYKGQPLTERTLKNYKVVLNKLKAFEKYKNRKYRFEQIDLNFYQDFLFYCRNIEHLNNNSIGTLIDRIKTFCRNIELEGYAINPMFKHRDFTSPTNETKDIYLKDSEIDAIFTHDFSHSESLSNARDLFIIGLRTGLRVSDFLRIGKANILGNVIHITTTKTRQSLTIPIHPQFQSILSKRNGEFPYKIADQKFNVHIKEICKKVGIDETTPGAKIDTDSKRKKIGNYPKYELVSSHICRRSFATNLFLAGFDNHIIMKATGHKTETQFLKYIKATNDEHLKKISEYWNKQPLADG